MKNTIKELHKIEAEDYTKLYEMYLGAFAEYPKLALAFKNSDDRLAAIGMTISYYLAYDLKYGTAYSLDENINEAVAAVPSGEMDYSEERCRAANCENEEFQKFAAKLMPEQVQLWWDFFDELDKQEAALDIPRPHIYVDYVAVRKGMQGQHRGSKLIRALERYADGQNLPIMLFTNGDDDIRFYIRNGFRIIGVTGSDKYGFENTYMLYEPKTAGQCL